MNLQNRFQQDLIIMLLGMRTMTCPKCHAETSKLVIPLGGVLSCRECVGERRTQYNPMLNQAFASDGVTRLSNGKAWEIKNRIVSKDDGHTLINKITGKPAQY